MASVFFKICLGQQLPGVFNGKTLKSRELGAWQPFDGGATFGLPGSEGGVTVRDEECESGARATLERDCQHSPWAVTCGIHGWFFHTRFLKSEAEAEFPAMLNGLAAILDIIPRTDDPEFDAKRVLVCAAIDQFVARFP